MLVQAVRVARDQSPAAQTEQVRVGQNGFDQPFAKTVCAVLFMNVYIADIRKDGVIADDARDADLFRAFVNAEDQRIGECAFGAFARTAFRPVGAREKISDVINVQALRISADGD